MPEAPAPGVQPLDGLVAWMMTQAGRRGGFLARESWPNVTVAPEVGGSGRWTVLDLLSCAGSGSAAEHAPCMPAEYRPSAKMVAFIGVYYLTLLTITTSIYLFYTKWMSRQEEDLQGWGKVFFPQEALSSSAVTRGRAAAVARECRSRAFKMYTDGLTGGALDSAPNSVTDSSSGDSAKSKDAKVHLLRGLSSTSKAVRTGYLHKVHTHMEAYFKRELLEKLGHSRRDRCIFSDIKLMANAGTLEKVKSTKFPEVDGLNKHLTKSEFIEVILPVYLDIAQRGNRPYVDMGFSRLLSVVNLRNFEVHACQAIFNEVDRNQSGFVSIDELERYILYFCELDDDSDSESDSDSSGGEEEQEQAEELEPNSPAGPLEAPGGVEQASGSHEQETRGEDRRGAAQELVEAVFDDDEMNKLEVALQETELDRQTNDAGGSINLWADMLLGGPAKVTQKWPKVLLAGLLQTGETNQSTNHWLHVLHVPLYWWYGHR